MSGKYATIIKDTTTMNTTYALWDKISQQYLSWKHPTMKNTMVHVNGYVNHRAIAVIKITGTTIVGEMSKDTHKMFTQSRVNLMLAQKLYLPLK